MLTLRYFAALRETLGPHAQADWHEGLTVATLRQALAARDAAHASALGPQRLVRAAINQRMVDDDAPIPDGAEVAFFPPVTGG